MTSTRSPRYLQILQAEDTVPDLTLYLSSVSFYFSYMLRHDSMAELSDILRQNLSKEAISTAHKRKTVLCQKVCFQLVQCFTHAKHPAPRKWAGQFILELILQFDKNKQFLISMPDGIRGILDVLFEDDDQCLRIIAAAIMREVAICEPKLSELSAIDSRVKLLKNCLGFFLPNRNSSWLKEAMKIISDRIKPRHDSFCTMAVSIEGLEGYTIPADCLFFTVSQSSVIVLIMDKNRFNLIDIPLGSIKGVEAKGNKLRILLGQRCYLLVNGIEQYSNNILVGMEKLTTRDNETILYKRPKEGAMTIIAFQDCVNDSDQEGSIGSHIPIPTDSGYDVGCMLWQEPHRQPSSSAIIELPTGEEVLSVSQLSLQSSHPLQPQPLPQQPPEQYISNQTGGAPATGGVSPTIRKQLQPLNASPHSVNQPSKQVPTEATKNHVEVLQTSPISSISPTSNVEEVGEVDRAAGVLDDLPNLAKQALLLQPQLLNLSLQTTEKETTDTPPLEDGACGKLTLAAEKPTAIIPDSQPVVDVVDTMAGSGPFKSPQETEKATGESGSANNSRLKRPTHKLCGSSSKKADLDWDEGLRVEPDIPLPQPETSASAKNAKQAPQDIEKTRTKGRKKSNSRAKQKIKPLELTSQTSNALKENKRNNQVTKTLTSARQTRNAAEAANKKMALAAERENAVYGPDDPIESSYPGSTSLEDLAEHIQIDDQSMPQADPPPPNRESTTTAKPLTNDSSDLSGGVPLHCGKDAMVETPGVAPETLGKQATKSQETKATGLDSRKDSVINLCSDSPQDEGTNQTRQSKTKQISGVDLPTITADCISEEAAMRNKPQSIAKKLAATLACLGLAPVKERQTTKTLENKEGADTTLNLVSQRKRETGNPSQVSKNVCEFMSRNQLSAQKPIIASNARKSGQEKSKNQGKPTSKPAEVNSSALSLQKGNRTANVVQTEIPPMTTRYEQQKPTRSVKFDLGVSHTPTSSTGPSDNVNSIDGKAVLASTTRHNGGSSLSSLTNDDAPMASENTEDEDEEQTSSSLDELPKYTSVRPKQIGWQSRTVDENGSPIPRLQHARKSYSQRVLGVLDETDKPKVPPHLDMPPAISEHSQVQGMTTFNPSAYSNSKTRTNRDIAGRHSFQSSNMFAPGERHVRRCHSMKANDQFHDQKVPRGKFEGRNKSATSSYKKSFDLMQRLKAHQTNPIPRTMGKRHHMIDVRDSKPFKVIEHDEDAVNTEAETDEECSPPRYPPESSEYVESQGHEWEKQLRDNYKGGRDILLDTSKQLSRELWESENRLYKSVDIYRVGCTRMIDQLEEIQLEKLDQSENALRPIKKRFLGMFENFSKRLENDLESIHKASSTLPTTANRGQRLNNDINSAIDEYKSRLIRSTNI
ncbi:hypothetical protein H112_01908 [Trichophyton rubrum D6]|nr:hypothetical protein H100_01904 [Trichophyton rubrum MR850]EZF66105.1 hypothetical protein H104_01888 [Trichophyton rubrum CBS 289.86]EZF87460.1 hypothetical protein H110_01911 [Trichophyton rubrum MR1448]EZF98210.1 hypothetical protein H113_01909 [Trichophyton rubrum MR1459]EZG19746.1 hypothetical protein H107_01971 [Trichophyton rubrum CBS 202.88]KDB36680.1 hypothetical protein H112_01908 [Trichophyton rubrum D6]KMQ45615.1 hypothetical protein HL42_3725 [Trichophyton rubrum]